MEWTVNVCPERTIWLISGLLTNNLREAIDEISDWGELKELFGVDPASYSDEDFEDSDLESYADEVNDKHHGKMLIELKAPVYTRHNRGTYSYSWGVCNLEWVLAEDLKDLHKKCMKFDKKQHARADAEAKKKKLGKGKRK